MAKKFIFWTAAIGVGYLAFGSSTSLAIDKDTCEPKGFVASFRRGINPQGFYKDQIEAIDSSIQKINKRMLTQSQVQNYEKSLAPSIEAETNKKMEEIYQKNPSLRPSYQEMEAQRLRERADLIEDQAFDMKMKSMSLNRISQLENCRYNLASRLK
jgi:hypothetical protein